MNLARKECVPCRAGSPRLEPAHVATLLKELPGWKTTKEGSWLTKSYAFQNFQMALDFANRVGAVAEAQNHHPDLELGWGYLRIKLQTHAVGGLHENDFVLAAKIDALPS